ncbi:hypothetical protein, partial [Parvularcula maris]
MKTLAILAAAGLTAFGSSQAAIVNGDFSAGGTGFFVFEEGGTVVFPDGAATLATDPGLGFDVLVASVSQGDDGLFTFEPGIIVPDDATALRFDILQAAAVSDPAEEGLLAFRPDALGVSLLDAEDPLLDVFDFFEAGDTGTFTLDVTSLEGRTVALFIDLFDEDDGFDTSFTIDNIAFVTEDLSPVPLPGAFAF